jgi:hypothetical protein
MKGFLMRAPRIFVRSLLALAIAVALVRLAPATAQDTPISDAKLQSFIAADLKVGELIDQWTPRINAASSPEQASQLKQQANTELVQAIKSSGGISVEEFKQISQSAESDPALQQRIADMLHGATR